MQLRWFCWSNVFPWFDSSLDKTFSYIYAYKPMRLQGFYMSLIVQWLVSALVIFRKYPYAIRWIFSNIVVGHAIFSLLVLQPIHVNILQILFFFPRQSWSLWKIYPNMRLWLMSSLRYVEHGMSTDLLETTMIFMMSSLVFLW